MQFKYLLKSLNADLALCVAEKKSSKPSKVDYGKVKKGYSGSSRKPDDDDF